MMLASASGAEGAELIPGLIMLAAILADGVLNAIVLIAWMFPRLRKRRPGVGFKAFAGVVLVADAIAAYAVWWASHGLEEGDFVDILLAILFAAALKLVEIAWPSSSARA
jgi:hypothetical protein